ncbi:unnamed protein product [Amoebophrya sp. A120]|nr:unnamed protein product [Amoebophrya sp. A120]|eukprot:GSA120T00004338001.1
MEDFDGGEDIESEIDEVEVDDQDLDADQDLDGDDQGEKDLGAATSVVSWSQLVGEYSKELNNGQGGYRNLAKGARALLEEYHTHCQHRTLNLILELGGTGLHFISAESLILDVLLHKDKEGTSADNVGFSKFAQMPQTLPAIHALEKVLGHIRDAGGRTMRLIFFDCYEQIFHKLAGSGSAESFWLLRQAFFLHCMNHSKLDVARFKSWYDQDFITHVKEWRPSFFLLSDEFLTDALAREEEEEEDSEEEELKKGNEPEIDDKFVQQYWEPVLKSLTIQCLRHKLPVAHLHGLEHKGHRIMCFTLGLENNCRLLADYMARIYDKDYDTHNENRQASALGAKTMSASSPMEVEDVDEVSSSSALAEKTLSGTSILGPSSPLLLENVPKCSLLYPVEHEDVQESGEKVATIVSCMKQLSIPFSTAVLLNWIQEYVQNEDYAPEGEFMTSLLFIFKSFVLTNLFKDELPLLQRCFTSWEPDEDGEGFLDDTLETIVGKFQEYSAGVMQSFVQVNSGCDTFETDSGIMQGVNIEKQCDFQDFVDVRLLRHVAGFLLQQKASEVDVKVFDIAKDLKKKLQDMWENYVVASGACPANCKAFWPIAVDLEEFSEAPPELPAAPGMRSMPEIAEIKSDLLQEVVFSKRELKTMDPNAPKDLDDEPKLFDGSGWKVGTAVSSVGFEEHMEENRGQKKERERKAAIIKKKGFLSKADLEFFAKGAARSRQLAVRAISNYANSLTGSKGLHKPILVKDEKMLQDEKKLAAAQDNKSKKHMELLKKNEEKAIAEAKKKDEERLVQWERDAEGLNPSSTGVTAFLKVQQLLLEMAAGYPRYSVVDDFTGFKDGISKFFQTKEARTKIAVKMLGHIRKFLKKVNLNTELKSGDVLTRAGSSANALYKAGSAASSAGSLDKTLSVAGTLNTFMTQDLGENQQGVSPRMAQFVCYIFNFCHTVFKEYGQDLEGKGIRLLQEVLIALGFPESATKVFRQWAEMQAGDESSPNDSVDPKKDAKDDKKSKKEDKLRKTKSEMPKQKLTKKELSVGGKSNKEDNIADLKKTKSSLSVTSRRSDKLDDYYVDPRQITSDAISGKDQITPYEGPTLMGGEQAFQLSFNGRYMERKVGTRKDERVLFKPDDWQSDLLTVVDNNQSALVVAPTASGKTFICYYTMEKVLSTDHEGIAVYVAPSKALVNQVSAEIFARFSSKNYPPNAKNELLGVFLREMNSAGGVAEQGKWVNTQVLVTIPHILETILLSPEKHEWVKRLRYIVFDEVHCIGESEGGAQWERTMQLIPCPFIALSATVANPENFHNWLSLLQEKKFPHNPKVHLIKHTERWNDLYKFAFIDGSLYPLHPFACLNERTVRTQGVIADFSMTPSETSTLVRTFTDLFSGDKDPAIQAAIKKLNPRDFFLTNRIITKTDFRKYEKLVLQTLLGGTGAPETSSDPLVRTNTLMTGSETITSPANSSKDNSPTTIPEDEEVEENLDAGQRKMAVMAQKFEAASMNSGDEGSIKEGKKMLLDKDKFNMLLTALRVLPRKNLPGLQNNLPKLAFSNMSTPGVTSNTQTPADTATPSDNNELQKATSVIAGKTQSVPLGGGPVTEVVQTQLEKSMSKTPGGGSAGGFFPHLQSSTVDVSKMELQKTASGAKMYQFLRELDRTENLPTIIFNFNRVDLKKMMSGLCKHMQDMQYEKYLGTEDARAATKQENAKREAEFNRKLKLYEAQLKLKANDEDFDETTLEEPVKLPNVEDELDREFSFHSEKAYGQWKDSIDEEFKMLRLNKRMDRMLIAALERGIGMHNESMPTKYRQLVEVLFRRGFLKVVFATGTLALGINMPCRSVVFTGNDVELNGLMFRQMAGRGGRRGFDLLGNVIFFGVPFEKIAQLVAADLPTLSGEMNLSPTTLLRVLVREQGLQEVKESGKVELNEMIHKKCLQPLFECPFFQASISSETLGTQLALHAKYSLEFLHKEGLITPDGVPFGLAGLVAFSFECEPANLVLNRLLRSNALHAYLKNAKKSEVKDDRNTWVSTKLCAVLAQFFLPKRNAASIEQGMMKRTQTMSSRITRRKHLPSPDCPSLPPLPESIRKEILIYNEDISHTYMNYIWSTCATKKYETQPGDFTLPMTGVKCLSEYKPEFTKGLMNPKSTFSQWLKQSQSKFKARSIFSAMTGLGDHFENYRDAIVNTRSSVAKVDMNSIPVIDLEHSRNSYLLDFLAHGQLRLLTTDNGLNQTEAYASLSSFLMALLMIDHAIGQMAPPLKKSTTGSLTGDIVVLSLKDLIADLKARLSKA